MNAVGSLLSAFGLSTAAGLNAYIPLLAVGLLARYTDLIHLDGPYVLLTHPLVLLLLALLALLDFVADKIPAIDHIAHMVGVLIHPIAGALLFMTANNASGTLSPFLAALFGMVLAGGTHGLRAIARPVATASTAGIANPFVSLIEDITSFTLAVLALLVPAVAVLLIFLIAYLVIRSLRDIARRRTGTASP